MDRVPSLRPPQVVVSYCSELQSAAIISQEHVYILPITPEITCLRSFDAPADRASGRVCSCGRGASENWTRCRAFWRRLLSTCEGKELSPLCLYSSFGLVALPPFYAGDGYRPGKRSLTREWTHGSSLALEEIPLCCRRN